MKNIHKRDYNSIPWYRRSGWNTVFIFMILIKILLLPVSAVLSKILFIFGLKPEMDSLVQFLNILNILLSLPILITIYSLLTGDIYINKIGENGLLKKWGVLNKVIALIIAIWIFSDVVLMFTK